MQPLRYASTRILSDFLPVVNEMEFNKAALNRFEKLPIRKINIADAPAAAIHHASPILGIDPPSVESKAVPKKASTADIHV